MQWKSAIRRALPQDAPELTAVAHAAKASLGYPAAWLDAWAVALTFTPEYVAHHTILVAEEDDGIVGVAALEERRTEAELGHLWVRPDRQGVGVGTALLFEVLGRAASHGFDRIRIESDPYAVAFYLGYGAVRIGEVPAPVEGAPDRVLPVLELPTFDAGS